MPTTDDRTPNLDLPLPHADNSLTVDVARMREALTTLDTLLALQDVEEVQTIGTGQTVVDFTILTANTGCTVFIDGIRLNADDWTPHPTVTTRITLEESYGEPKTITIVRRQGGV